MSTAPGVFANFKLAAALMAVDQLIGSPFRASHHEPHQNCLASRGHGNARRVLNHLAYQLRAFQSLTRFGNRCSRTVHLCSGPEREISSEPTRGARHRNGLPVAGYCFAVHRCSPQGASVFWPHIGRKHFFYYRRRDRPVFLRLGGAPHPTSRCRSFIPGTPRWASRLFTHANVS